MGVSSCGEGTIVERDAEPGRRILRKEGVAV